VHFFKNRAKFRLSKIFRAKFRAFSRLPKIFRAKFRAFSRLPKIFRAKIVKFSVHKNFSVPKTVHKTVQVSRNRAKLPF